MQVESAPWPWSSGCSSLGRSRHAVPTRGERWCTDGQNMTSPTGPLRGRSRRRDVVDMRGLDHADHRVPATRGTGLESAARRRLRARLIEALCRIGADAAGEPRNTSAVRRRSQAERRARTARGTPLRKTGHGAALMVPGRAAEPSRPAAPAGARRAAPERRESRPAGLAPAGNRNTCVRPSGSSPMGSLSGKYRTVSASSARNVSDGRSLVAGCGASA